MDKKQKDEYDGRLSALEDYRLYKADISTVDETENLPNGIFASIIRHEPTNPCDLEDDDSVEDESDDCLDELSTDDHQEF
jgi:hypothetical protein